MIFFYPFFLLNTHMNKFDKLVEKILEEQKNNVTEACWKNYKQVGMKKKGKKNVPNCVKK